MGRAGKELACRKSDGNGSKGRVVLGKKYVWEGNGENGREGIHVSGK